MELFRVWELVRANRRPQFLGVKAMTSASTVPHDIRETTKDARESAREVKE